MKKLAQCLLSSLVIGAVGVQPVQAQDGGFGAFLDWINKLSGPQMTGPSAAGWVRLGEESPWRLRGSVARRRSDANDRAVSPSGSQITDWVYQLSGEYALGADDEYALGAGVALHSFGGDSPSFTHLGSIPVYALVRLPSGSAQAWKIVATAGVQIFTPLEAADFLPLTVRVEDKVEPVAWLTFGVEYTFDIF